MYRIKLPSDNQLTQFLSICDVEYVDVYFNDDSIVFIENTNEVFAQYQLAAEHSIVTNEVACRIPKGLLTAMKDKSVIIIEMKESFVNISFADEFNDILCSVRIDRQVVYSQNYEHKRELANSVKIENLLDSNKLADLIKIAKSSGGMLSIDCGVACVYLPSGARVYCKCDYPYSVCMLPDSIATLKKCSNKFFNVENYLGAKDNNFVVLATKARAIRNDEYLLIAGQKSPYKAKYVADVGLEKLCTCIAKLRPKCELVGLNVADKNCTLTVHRITFIVPVQFSNEKKAVDSEMNIIQMPISIISQILFNLPSRRLLLKQKRNFVQLEQGEYTIIF